MPPLTIKKIKKYRQTAPSITKKSIEERERLISQYAPLVKTITGRLAIKLPQHISQDDLASAGIIGLLDAIDKFDVEKGVEFRSYAEFRIRGAMIDELRSMDWVPRSVRRNAKRLEVAYNAIENRKMRPARDEEVAEELGIDMDAFYQLLEAARGISIINEYEIVNKTSKSEGNGLSQSALFSAGSTPMDSLDITEIKDIIAKAIDKLPKNERTIMALYYYEELTMKEIGKIMGYTESRVSQLHTKALIRLRNSLKEYFDI
ncbi:MAG: FliA/WhiG family RNA polymerase sigma factor [Deltaproteobacteria bacterium]|nr:FliA/WhiG family RNA polymerase sigma factor [Deltaproteobacteria bacterium]